MNEMRIATLRRERGWTQERLAEASGVAVRTVQRLEGGNDASLETLSAIARALEVPVRELFAQDDPAELEPGVRGLDERTEAAAAAAASEQAARDRFVGGFWSLYSAVGIAFGILAVLLLVLHVWSPLVFLLVGAYWAVGRLAGRFLLDSVLGPWLDRRWPLSSATDVPVRAAR
ncbi:MULTISPECIES: helix-turn-helix domain-containing protein [unclassified Curtobacterium]|uniref:helix-turn-helix domain-containing protein n=1 Tax=unclassified Curtobacterium TaxID=257496 RepID=UPI0008377E1B|nr:MULTISPECIES: helix-turn-helix transcriptional regulator [unclassified Curtobacterium]MCM3505493.1 helix-turn-helix transcriptional regulator [Curtobacterium sp. ODYSSEY 48 V2]MCM3522380.1 helix-turn-helix transcriptional regulator [Curtobacterium sp. P97]